MRIIGPATASPLKVRDNLIALNAEPLFINEMFLELWKAAEDHVIDPVGMVAQSYKETGGGRFGRAVTPQHYNTAGIKNRHIDGQTDADPNAHAKFPNWEVGAIAQAQHLRAYTGWAVEEIILDPRYFLALGKHRLENWSELSGKWAPSSTYGLEVER